MNVADLIKEELKDRKDILLTVLFGSQVSVPRADSDVDVAVLCTIPLSVDDKLVLTESLRTACSKEVDVIDLAVAHGAILQEVLTRGTVIFCQDPSIYEKLQNRMLREKEDDTRMLAKIVQERRRIWSRQI